MSEAEIIKAATEYTKGRKDNIEDELEFAFMNGAAFGQRLLLDQLEQGRYTVRDTRGKR